MKYKTSILDIISCIVVLLSGPAIAQTSPHWQALPNAPVSFLNLKIFILLMSKLAGLLDLVVVFIKPPMGDHLGWINLSIAYT